MMYTVERDDFMYNKNEPFIDRMWANHWYTERENKTEYVIYTVEDDFSLIGTKN